ncbi:MAG: shikimate dehydrogenase [Caulobacteraceae bacterium]|jgi:shikimate dehydrogenase|nr:shikimate dehydrogenase [Caulobacteraceae bacterium]
MSAITARTRVAGVAGAPVRHSLSPLLHNAWLKAAGVDGVYVAFAPPQDGFPAFAQGLRRGAVAGINVTIPFKEEALAAADTASDLARAAGAANLLLFHEDGRIEARNTDGEGMLRALAAQAPGFDASSGPALVLGAGGAARGAIAALLEAGAPRVNVCNRTLDRAEHLAARFGPRVRAWERPDLPVLDAAVIVNATSLGLGGGAGPPLPWDRAPAEAVVMDMVYKPLRTQFLIEAEARGLRTVDGLEMLIRQAAPSFEALFGVPPPADIDARVLLLAALEAGG